MKLLTLWSFLNPLLLLDLLTFFANHKGSEGVVHIGTNLLAELRSWDFTESAETIEDTILSDADKTFKAGNKSWAGSMTCWWDETDTNGQSALGAGDEATVKFYAEGTGTGSIYYSGTAIVTGVQRQAGINGIVEAIYSVQGSGAMSTSTA